VMTTIDDIPDALLRNILASCLLIKAQLPPQPYDARLVLPSVCPKWRNIIITNPAFWQNIALNPLPLFETPLNLFNLANTWLTRSGCLPLSLEFNEELQYYQEQGRNPKYMAHFLFGGSVSFKTFYTNVISRHATRVRRFTCNLITKATITSFFSIPPESFPNIEALNIRFMDEITLPPSLKLFTVAERAKFKLFCSLPRLRIVIMEICVGSGIRPLYLRFPWYQLTTLQMNKTPISPECFLRILKKASPSLVDGVFNIVFSAQHSTPPNGYLTHVTMPRLESLRLRLFNPSTDSRLFNVVRLPALRTLWIELVDVKKGWNMGLYKSLLLHSSKTIQSLGFKLCNHPPDAQPLGLLGDGRSLLRRALKLEALLHVVNNIDALHLPAGVQIDPTTLKKIATGELLPFLRYLKVSSTSVSLASILDAVRKRHESFVCTSRAASTSQDYKPVPPFSLFSVDVTTIRVEERRAAGTSKGPKEVYRYQCYETCIRFVDEWLTIVD
jgi:hypothetical protein